MSRLEVEVEVGDLLSSFLQTNVQRVRSQGWQATRLFCTRVWISAPRLLKAVLTAGSLLVANAFLALGSTTPLPQGILVGSPSVATQAPACVDGFICCRCGTGSVESTETTATVLSTEHRDRSPFCSSMGKHNLQCLVCVSFERNAGCLQTSPELAIKLTTNRPNVPTAPERTKKRPQKRWWVRNVGTVPIQRRSDHGAKADNTDAMAKLYEALQGGDMVCVFPEGVSRYQSGLAPLRPGVGRIVLEVRVCAVCVFVVVHDLWLLVHAGAQGVRYRKRL